MTLFHHLIMAQSEAEVIQTMKEPGFAQWVVYLLVFLFVVRELRSWIQPAKREVTGTMQTTPAPTVASKEDLAKVEAQLVELRETTRAEHQAAVTAGQQRVVSLSEVMDNETTELERALTAMREAFFTRLDAAFQTLSAKIDPVVASNAAHHAVLPLLADRMNKLESAHQESVSQLTRRVDDAIRLAGSVKK